MKFAKIIKKWYKSYENSNKRVSKRLKKCKKSISLSKPCIDFQNITPGAN